MVKCNSELDRVFGALADPTRRAILERLARGQSRVSALAEPFAMSAPAVSRHLRVLESAGLITRDRIGREHHITADPVPLQEARDWLAIYAAAWEHQFDRLDEYLKSEMKARRGAEKGGDSDEE